MSIGAVSYVMLADAPTPLAKLVLIRFANECDGSGQLVLSDYVRFCCASEESVNEAVRSLVDAGFLIQNGPQWFTIAGYVSDAQRKLGHHMYVKRVLSNAVRSAVFARDGFMCKACGTQDNLTLDHIIPERHGGSDEVANLQTLCRLCNCKKGTRRG